MNKQEINRVVKEHQVKKGSLTRKLSAFVSGGVLGALGQGVLELYMKQLNMTQAQAAAPLAMTFIAVAALATGLGFYDRLGQRFGAGLFIPITGFSNSLSACALESKSEGLIFGIGCNMFKLAGSVLTYGIVAAYTLGIIRYFLGF